MSRDVQRRWVLGVLEADLDGGELGSMEALAPFQRTAAVAVERALGRWGGVLLADEVGMGKTHVALAALEGRTPALVCAPASLLGMWRRALSEAGVEGVSLCSHALLARRVGSFEGFGLVVVDEAHAFVNPAAQRTRALARLGRSAPLMLLTATPVGLSPKDLGRLLRLFVPPGAMVPMLGAPLEAVLHPDHPDPGPLLRTVVIRRSRAFVERRWPDGIVVQTPSGATQRLRFPHRIGRRLVWSLNDPGGPARFASALAQLDAEVLGIDAGLLSGLLFGRLESSPAALMASIGRIEGFLRRRLEAVEAGGDLDRHQWRRLFGALLAQEDRQQVLPFVFEGAQATQASAIRRSLAMVQRMAQIAGPWAQRAPKFEVLSSFVAEREGPTILFTRYGDTAQALFDALRARFPKDGVGLIRGSGAWLGGRDGAGQSWRVPPDEIMDRLGGGGRRGVRILVTTDVLAEGVNLQVCTAAVSVDLPWNPRRLIQRLGRIDRLGPGERTVEVAIVAPSPDLERIFGRVGRVALRAERMEAALGDRAALGRWLLDTRRDAGADCFRETEVEFDMRADKLALKASTAPNDSTRLPPGWRVRATPRHPPGVVFVVDPGLAGALLQWWFVPDSGGEEVFEGRSRLYPRVQVLLRCSATAQHQPPSRALRRVFAAALTRRQRLKAATLGPCVHPPASAVARLLRAMVEDVVDVDDSEGIERRAAAMRALERPVGADISAMIEAALIAKESAQEIGDRVVEQIGARAAAKIDRGIEVVGFVVFGEGVS